MTRQLQKVKPPGLPHLRFLVIGAILQFYYFQKPAHSIKRTCPYDY